MGLVKNRSVAGRGCRRPEGRLENSPGRRIVALANESENPGTARKLSRARRVAVNFHIFEVHIYANRPSDCRTCGSRRKNVRRAAGVYLYFRNKFCSWIAAGRTLICRAWAA